MKVRNAGVQSQKFLCPSGFLEASLTSFQIPGGPVRLFNQVIAARSGNDLAVLNAVEHRKRSNSRPVTSEVVRLDDLWDGRVDQQTLKEGLGCISVPVRLQEDVEHCTGF